MNWSGKMWAFETEDGTLIENILLPPFPYIVPSRAYARLERKFHYPDTKVVRVQVDVKVIE